MMMKLRSHTRPVKSPVFHLPEFRVKIVIIGFPDVLLWLAS